MENQTKRKILIVEDDRSLMNALTEIVTQENFEVVGAYDGEGALEKIKQVRPDLVLLDIILPKKDGFEVLRELKENPETKDIPVMILTNLEEVDNIQKALDLGATNYLVKSDFSLKEVIEKIKENIK